MKRIYFLAAWCLLFLGAQLLVTCSSPLEPEDRPEPVPPIVDTVIEYDTIFLTDTVSTTDTLVLYDTTTITDTFTVVDTIELSDTVILVDTLIETDTLIEVDTLTIYDTTIIVDTLISVDTVTLVDTLEIYDTTTIVDTVEIFDTTVVVDTVEIVIPDPSCIKTICSKLSCNQNKIIWNFRNMAGIYQLVFEATIEDDHPPKTLIVKIDGEEYEWHIDHSTEFMLETTLDEDAIIRIEPSQPLSLGHWVNVCLT
ncbi:MAG: hypothetical protein ACE5K8_02050, partial [Candidatus Zixiibacteriota bacterium]